MRKELSEIATSTFDYDGLRTNPDIILNHGFMKDSAYIKAYRRGLQSCGLNPDGVIPYYMEMYWRLHVALWAAGHAQHLPGAFVECGVNRGFLSSAICSFYNWNEAERDFFLFDTFNGIDESLVVPEEISRGNLPHFRNNYTECYDLVKDNFSEFERIHIVRGSVPSTLATVDIPQVAFLSIDMNNVTPEIAAVNFFWDRLVPGAVVVLDDYGFVGYEVQKREHDRFAREHNISILSLPTGQGMWIKP